MSNEAIEAAKVRAAQLREEKEQAAKQDETVARDPNVIVGEDGEKIKRDEAIPTPAPDAPVVIPKGTNLTHVDLDALDPTTNPPTTNPAVVDMTVNNNGFIAPLSTPSLEPSGVAQQFHPQVVTPNFGGGLTQGVHPMIPQAATQLGQAPVASLASLHQAIVDEKSNASTLEPGESFKTYKHMYAGANTIMPDGKRLTFGGHPGGNGYYTTKDPAEQQYLNDMCRQVSSQISTENGNLTPELTSLQAQTVVDTRRNTVLDVDPNVANARANMANVIASEGRRNNN